jgi:3-phosphoshikimate 1-carboxyvinyltransferase
VAPVNGLRVGGVIRPASDKSISHRSLMLAAVAKGKSRIRNLLASEDVLSTAQVLRAIGAAIPHISDDVVVTGASPRGLKSPGRPLDCGNSGTTARLMAGIVAGAGLTAEFRGDDSLSRRPMRRVAEPLMAMGAMVRLPKHGGLPMTIMGGPLQAIEWESPVASAQIKSSILLAAVLGGVSATIEEPHRSRDHTERMLTARGVDVHVTGTRIEVPPAQVLRPADIDVPADPSSAAFFVALALLATSGELRLTDVCLNPTRTGLLEALRRMGGNLEVEGRRDEGGEHVGDVVARPSQLRGISVSADEVPSMIDELPLLACVAACAEGVTTVRGAAELRVKESDRIAAIVNNLKSLGADARELEDGFQIKGPSGPLLGRVDPLGDHRIAMSFGILSALAGSKIDVVDPDCVAVSYPDFWRHLSRAVSS